MEDMRPEWDPERQDPQFYKHLLDCLNDAVYFVDRDRRITYWNEGAGQLTGFARHEALGRRCQDNFLCHVNRAGEQLCTGHCPLAATIADREPREAHLFLRHKDGHRVAVRVRVAPILSKAGDVMGAVEIFSDDSARESAKHKAEELEKLAFLDPLTQVANRRYLEIRLESALREFAMSGNPFGLLVIDVDWFKEINDQQGHEAGDRALVTVARALGGLLRSDDVLGRWGGDEFIALLSHADPQTLALVAERCRALVRQTQIPHAKGTLAVTVSVGGALIAEGESAESLVKRADRLMYVSKASGRDQSTVE